MPSIIASIEDDLVATVQALFAVSPSGNRLRVVDTLPADFDRDAVSRALMQAPGAYIVFGGGADPNPGGMDPQIDGEWSVVAITNHASGEKARRRGDAMQIGAYEICETIAKKMHRHVVPNVGSLIFQRITNLYEGSLDQAGVAVYQVAFKLNVQFWDEPAPGSLVPFEVFHGTFKLGPPDEDQRPKTEVTVDLPQE